MNELKEVMEKEIEKIIKKLSKRYNMNEKEAKRHVLGVGIEEKKSRGRPRVEKKEKEKGARGRPRMEEKVVTSNVGEDLIRRLIMNAKKEYML
jgi:ABC-type lipoprotein release transport system permease subunit